jgi:lysophospholipase
MQLYETPDNRLPQGTEVYAAHARGNLRLRAMTAPPLTPEARGTVVFLNGRADFVERYFETMGDMQRRGFHVAGFDWRGQGGSQRLLKDPMRGHIRSYREYDEDLRTVMEGVVTKNCPGPYYAIAHSTGGHILLRSLSRQKWFKRAIVTAPLMELQYGSWPKSVSFVLAAMATGFGFGWAYLPGFKKPPFLFRGFDDNPLTSDPKRWARDLHLLQQHTSLGVGGPTYAWLVATMLSIKDLHSRRKGQGLNCPVMMVLAGRERVVDNRAAHRFAANMPGVSVVTIGPSLHEIMLEKDEVRKEFLAVVDSYFGVTPEPGSA